MKKITYLLIVIVFSIFLYSCDDENIINEPENLYEPIVPGALSSIQVERINCSLSSAVINFEDDEIINILYSNGGKSEYSYSNGLLAERQEYHVNGILIFTYTYAYDVDGRISEINRFINYDNPIVEPDFYSNVVNQFEYNANIITRVDVYYESDGSIDQNQSNNEIYYYTNNQDVIIKFEETGWQEEIVYTNNNPTSINYSLGGDPNDNMILTHFEGVNMSGYQLEEYMFGAQWKNNLKLAYFKLFYGRTIIELLGDDQLKSYTLYNADGSVDMSLNVNYDVDQDGRLKTQNRVFMSSGVPSYENITYIFED